MGASKPIRRYLRLQQMMKDSRDAREINTILGQLKKLRSDFPVWVEHRGQSLAKVDNMSVVLCIGRDCRMNEGVAKDVSNAFPAYRRTTASGKLRVGKVATVIKQLSTSGGELGAQFIFNLVTKERHNDRATYRTLELALRDLLRQVRTRKITKLALPMLGCGRDRLSWERVKRLIDMVFDQYPIVLHLCTLED